MYKLNLCSKKANLPIPEDPRKRNTRGCSSSYQPFSLLRIAANKWKTDSVEYYSQICQTVVFQNWFCYIKNHTCSNCENGSFLSNNILFQSHLQRIAPSFLNLFPLFLFHILKNKLCHFNHKTQLHYLFFLLIEILPSLILTIQFFKILWYLPYTMQAQLTKIWRIASNRQ